MAHTNKTKCKWTVCRQSSGHIPTAQFCSSDDKSVKIKRSLTLVDRAPHLYAQTATGWVAMVLGCCSIVPFFATFALRPAVRRLNMAGIIVILSQLVLLSPLVVCR